MLLILLRMAVKLWYVVFVWVAGFQPNEIFDGAIIGNDEITPKLFTNATVVTY